MTRKPHSHIFRAYDIRGIYGETLFDEDAYHVGRRFAEVLLKESLSAAVVVGYDGRASSPSLYNALEKGLREGGAEVFFIGQVATPLLYFAEYTLDGVMGGIMITGSHNPPHHNGFKIVKRHAPFFGEEIKDLALPFKKSSPRKGGLKTLSVTDAYRDKLLEEVVFLKPLKVIWDTGNGVVGPFLQTFIERMPGEHILINGAVDARFPSHAPDPSRKENLLELRETVLLKGADIGIAFDGDGDRIGAITCTGDFWMSESLLFLFAADVLASYPRSTLIADVKVTNRFFDYVNGRGAKALMVPTGHSLIKKMMKETKSPFAGEYSGHMFFADRYYGFDDGIYAALRLLRLLSTQGYETLLKEIPPFYKTPELAVSVRSFEHKKQIMEHLKGKLLKEGKLIDERDGIRVTENEGWLLIRPSNTEDKIVFMGEGNSEESRALILEILECLMKEAANL